jgi:hypothetical protein
MDEQQGFQVFEIDIEKMVEEEKLENDIQVAERDLS